MTANYLPRLAEVARATSELLSLTDPDEVDRLAWDIMAEVEDIAETLRDTSPEIAAQMDEIRGRVLAFKFRIVDGVDEPYRP